MTKRNAGEQASAGYYLSTKNWHIHPVASDGERLPGEAGERWVRINVVAALVLTPILGLAFLMFLPFIGFYLTLEAAFRPLLRAVRHETTELVATMSPGWQPGEAHLTGKRHEENEGTETRGPPAQGELEKLAREIEAKRQAKK